MNAQYILDNLEKLFTSAASNDMDNARTKAKNDGHKYRVIDREGFRAALKRIIDENPSRDYQAENELLREAIKLCLEGGTLFEEDRMTLEYAIKDVEL